MVINNKSQRRVEVLPLHIFDELLEWNNVENLEEYQDSRDAEISPPLVLPPLPASVTIMPPKNLHDNGDTNEQFVHGIPCPGLDVPADFLGGSTNIVSRSIVSLEAPSGEDQAPLQLGQGNTIDQGLPNDIINTVADLEEEQKKVHNQPNLPSSGTALSQPEYDLLSIAASDDQNQPSLDSRVEEQQAQAQAQTPAQPTGVAMVVASSPSLVPFTSSLQEGGFLMCPLPQSPAQTSLIMSQTPIPAPGAPGGMVDVPILSDYEGKYGFTVTVDDKERTTKSPMWLMSNIVNKLYTNINKAVPFEASLKRPTGNEQLFVRAIPVFSSPEFLRINVNRCPNHAAPTDSTNHDFPYPEHVVRADHPAASYRKSASGRLSVVVPLDVQQNTSEYTPILLRFMCLGSCVGGIYRRPISIVLTLENCHEKVLGRKVIDVRVCACPTRDIKTDEQAALNKGNKRKGSSVQVMPVIRKKPRMVEPKMEQEEGGSQVFNLKVCGRQLYDYLVDMKHAYYRHHPEYALRHPDPSSSTNRSPVE